MSTNQRRRIAKVRRVGLRVVMVSAVVGVSGGMALNFGAGPSDASGYTVSSASLGGGLAPDTTNSTMDTPEQRLTFDRVESPNRTVVRNGRGAVVATLTDGARTVVLEGAPRRFAEPGATSAVVNTTSHVRLAPKVWREGAEQEAWFRPWLREALRDDSPDVLAIATDYLAGHADQVDDQSVRFAGNAAYGPRGEQAGTGASDFYDYLGVSWSFGDQSKHASAERYGSVGSAGFVRLVYGYRAGYPLSADSRPDAGLPRPVDAMAQEGTGVTVVGNTGRPATAYERLQPGDLVFFDNDPKSGPRMDHVGIYLGIDTDGKHRFVSSRATADGPTMGDAGGHSVLDLTNGHYTNSFRSAKRL